MTNGDTVFLAFATAQGSGSKPCAFVNEATVLDGENGVLRLTSSGQVLVHEPKWSNMTAHATEAEAWSACASRLAADVAVIEAEARRCASRAAEAAAATRIVRVPA